MPKADDSTCRYALVGAVTLLGLVSSIWMYHLLPEWLVDDAGISLAFADHLRVGDGLIPQAGGTPVEGYSNPLWVLLLALSSRSSDVELLKLFSGFLFLGSLVRLPIGLMGAGRLFDAALLTSALISLQPSVLIWCYSGLENPLSLLLGVELLVRGVRVMLDRKPQHNAVIGSVVCAFSALTRPEAIALAAAPAVSVLFSRIASKKRWIVGLIVVAVPIVTILFVIGFRIYYFGALLPNTYLAKGGPTLARLIGVLQLNAHTLEQVREFASSIFGYSFATWGCVLSTALLGVMVCTNGDRVLRYLVASAAWTMFIALLLPSDWMAENRYFTVTYVFFLLSITYAFTKIARSRREFIWIAIVAVAGSATNYIQRTTSFSEHPTISIAEVAERSEVFEHWGAALDVKRPSILTADIGGFLLRDHVVVVDLGMLCNRAIAQFLGEGSQERSVERFHDYVFNEKKPDFISTRAYHAWLAQLDSDRRFGEQYVPIVEYEDQWVQRRYGKIVKAGDFVKRTLVEGHEERLAQIRRDAASRFYPFCESCPGRPTATR